MGLLYSSTPWLAGGGAFEAKACGLLILFTTTMRTWTSDFVVEAVVSCWRSRRRSSPSEASSRPSSLQPDLQPQDHQDLHCNAPGWRRRPLELSSRTLSMIWSKTVSGTETWLTWCCFSCCTQSALKMVMLLEMVASSGR